MGTTHGSFARRARARVLVTLWLAIAALASDGCSRLPDGAVRQINEAHRAYQRRDYPRCERLVSPVIAEHRGQPDTAEAYYLRGLARLRTGRRDAAHGDFQAGRRIADRAELKALLDAQLGNLEYEAGHYQRAAAHYRRAEPGLPATPPTDRLLLRYGISLQRSGHFGEAKQVLAKLLLRFPSGRPAEQARRKVTWPHDYHAIQCGVYAQAASAKSAARRLRDQGVQATNWRETLNGTTRHVVRAGRFRSYAEAHRNLQQIRAVVPDAFVVP